ncbi:hypothetical protein [Haloarchaeobius sp. HRN-SO-5]|uniref:hypothetical protein n=1 Tax=Haloarchaeobius sp. HRN-SO-5 TaxID=3446118 RepID=UPI003EBA0302
MDPTDDVRVTLELDEEYRRELAAGNALAETTFAIRVDGTYLVGGPVGEQSEPVLLYLTKVLDGLDEVLDGTERWFGCLSLPGGLRVTPTDGAVSLWFGYAEGFNPDVPEAGLPVSQDACVRALLGAGRDLHDVVRRVETPVLHESRYVNRFERTLASADRRYGGRAASDDSGRR